MFATKTCPGCERTLRLIARYWHRRTKSKTGFQSRCKRCQCEAVAFLHARDRSTGAVPGALTAPSMPRAAPSPPDTGEPPRFECEHNAAWWQVVRLPWLAEMASYG